MEQLYARTHREPERTTIRGSRFRRRQTDREVACEQVKELCLRMSLRAAGTTAWRILSDSKVLGLLGALLIFGAWLTTNILQRRIAAEQENLTRLIDIQQDAAQAVALNARLSRIGEPGDEYEPTEAQLNAAFTALVNPTTPKAERDVATNLTFAPVVALATDTALIVNQEFAVVERLASAFVPLIENNTLMRIRFDLSLIKADVLILKSEKNPLNAVRQRRERLETIRTDELKNHPGDAVYEVPWDRDKATLWLARATAITKERAQLRAELTRLGLVLGYAAYDMAEFAQIGINRQAALARQTDYAALGLFALGSLIVLIAKIFELRTSHRTSQKT